ncbi:hypothetical protein FGU71_06170 [Erythrobacter insulae]|uniref:Uncharacterized protein n=1 Tax=Erythrobacter insulae TaxID=2584124 RepID=A0A547PBH4_9SPHN|nr:hypothetical protein [Erythrobacter insulae]TRD11481.1 hypothetical protein FGU71_06170 [Erythrobacter insulae]
MSSNAASGRRFSTILVGLAVLAGFTMPVAAQSESASQERDDAPESAPPFTIDLSVTVPRSESDRLLEEDCKEEADAARIVNEIIVCRQLGQASDGSWNKEEWQKGYAQRTKGGGTPDTFGIPNHGNPISIGSVPPPAIFIDVEALPQAPEGSDADRIARGLPPLGKNSEPTPEQIAERRSRLGLEARPLPPAPN